jgi:hypothetical protein
MIINACCLNQAYYNDSRKWQLFVTIQKDISRWFSYAECSNPPD